MEINQVDAQHREASARKFEWLFPNRGWPQWVSSDIITKMYIWNHVGIIRRQTLVLLTNITGQQCMTWVSVEDADGWSPCSSSKWKSSQSMYIVHTQQQDAKNHNNLALLDLGVFKHSHCLCLCLGGFCPRWCLSSSSFFVVDVI